MKVAALSGSACFFLTAPDAFAATYGHVRAAPAARLKVRPADRPLAEPGAQTALFTAANETVTSLERSGGRARARARARLARAVCPRSLFASINLRVAAELRAEGAAASPRSAAGS